MAPLLLCNAGNRTTNASLYNPGNQLTEDAGFFYEYDANGNLVRKTGKATGNHTDYTYDAENRLVMVEDFAAGATTPAFTSTYRYDGLGAGSKRSGTGRRAGTSMTAKTFCWSMTRRTRYSPGTRMGQALTSRLP